MSDGPIIQTVPAASQEETMPPRRRLTAEEAKVITESLIRPLGRYDSARASQLSGIPRRTVNYWFQHELLVPDDVDERLWSYRDLVYLRVFAWLRTKKMPPEVAAAEVRELKKAVIHGVRVTSVRSQGSELLLGNEAVDRMSGEMVFASIAPFFAELDLVAISRSADLEVGRYGGPDLLSPRSRVTIRPWVHSGEPCIRGTRITTMAVYSLAEDRGLEAKNIVRLYPGTSVRDVREAIDLETSLRAAA